MELHRRNGSSKWTLGSLRSLLKDEIRARDKSEYRPTPDNDKYKNKDDHSNPKGKGGRPGSASMLHMQGSDSQGAGARPKQGCAFCQGAHASWKCTKYPDFSSRQSQMSGRCICCLAAGHGSKDCRRRRRCYYCGANGHNSALCRRQFDKSTAAPSGQQHNLSAGAPAFSPFPTAPPKVTFSSPVVPSSADTTGIANCCPPTSSGYAILKSAQTVVVGDVRAAPAQFLFDDGSTLSFITAHKAREIGARPICRRSTAVSRFGDQGRAEVRYDTYLLNVKLANGQMVEVVLHETPNICAPIQVVPMDLAQYPFIASMQLAQQLVSQPTMVGVDILIGLDYYYRFIGVEHSRLSNGVVFLNSSLGFVISGFSNFAPRVPVVKQDTQMLILSESKPDFDLKNFWELESIGITKDIADTDAEYAQSHFDNHVQCHDGRYYVKWPYKFDSPPLSDNFPVVFHRLRSQQRHFQSCPSLHEHYELTFAEQTRRGIIETAPQDPDGLVYYMPHHAVFKPRSATTKIRIVYDASSKSKDGKSLNDCLLKGPLILSDLVGSILRFRLHPVALVSDIEKAFHMVGLAADQRDVTRFLWIRDPTKPVSVDNLVIYRFCRVPFGTVASSFLLAATIVHHLKVHSSKIAENILDNLYVDNVKGGVSNTESALRYYAEAKSLFRGASMNLRQWFSNSQEFTAAIDPADFGQTDTTTVLGINWSTSKDTLSCPAHSLSESKVELTKREILSALASLFDPCGWFSPVTTACVFNQQLTTDLLGTLLNTAHYFAPTRKSVLFISDSQARMFDSIQCGDVVPVSGGRYADIINVLASNAFDTRSYMYIVINCGANVYLRQGGQNPYTYEKREREWRDLKDALLLESDSGRRLGTILFCCAFDHPKVKGNAEHAREIQLSLQGTAIRCLNWRDKGNPFLQPSGRIWREYFWGDGFHLNTDGARVFWRHVCSMLPGLDGFNYQLLAKPDTISRDIFGDDHPPSRKRRAIVDIADGTVAGPSWRPE